MTGRDFAVVIVALFLFGGISSTHADLAVGNDWTGIGSSETKAIGRKN